MSARTYLAALTLIGGVLLMRPGGQPTLLAGDQPDLTTTLDDQSELAITVYNSDIALIRDVRNLQLARGTGNLRFMDIAAM